MSAPATDNEAGYPGQSDDDLLEKLARWRKDDDAHLSDWRDEAKDMFDLVSGEQWSQEDRERLDDLMRPHVTFNRVAPVIDAVSGAEIQGRQQVTYLPRQIGASAANEVLTKGAEWIRDRCDAEQEESDAARDTFICGLGWTETRIEYETDPNGHMMIERIDPLEIVYDCGARKANLADARRIRRDKPYSQDEFDEMWPDADAGGEDAEGMGRKPVIVDPELRYRNGQDDDDDTDEVIVSEWQWFEKQPFYRVAHPDTGEVINVPPEHYEPMAEQAKAAGVELGGVRQVKRVYYRVFESGGRLLQPVEELQVGEFTYKAMTGKRDRNKGVFYGLVRPMKDPQKFANKFFSQILHILNSNAKGGLLMEEDAASDQRQFEESYAKSDEITWMKSGALGQNPKIMPKNPPAYPAGQEKMMDASIIAIRDSTGVNQELLGLADRDQPGVLEHQRKQAAYGILSAFFDSFKRYRKIQGRLLLRMMQLFMPPDTLVRIVGDDGTAQYVPMALSQETIDFDVIVDDAPAGPNQKDQAFQTLLQLMPVLQNANLPPDIWAEFVRYSPLPNALAEKLIKALTDMAQNQAQAASQPSPEQQAQLALMGAKAQNDAASARHHDAQAVALQAQAGSSTAKAPGEQEAQSAQAALDRAKAAALMGKTVSDIIATHTQPLTSPA